MTLSNRPPWEPASTWTRCRDFRTMKAGYIIGVFLISLWVIECRLIPRRFPTRDWDDPQQRSGLGPPDGPDAGRKDVHEQATLVAETAPSREQSVPEDNMVPEVKDNRPNQPPQHFIPGLSVDHSLTHFIHSLYRRLVALIIYKPPIGIITIAMFYRLVGRGRIWKIYDVKDSEQDQPKTRQASFREASYPALVLDDTDQLYVTRGGVQSTRKRLLLAVATSLRDCSPLAQHRPGSEAHATRPGLVLLEAMVASLKATLHPGSPKSSYLRDILAPYARLQSVWSDSSILPGRIGPEDDTLRPVDKQRLLDLCRTTTDVCFTDAVARVCRDRLLASSLRLARAQEYWRRRVQRLQGMPKLFPLDKLVEGDRMRLALATAALQQELTRLGQLVTLLMETPTDMDNDCILQALRASEIDRQNEKQSGAVVARKPRHFPNIGSLTNKASQYYRDGTFSFRKMGNGELRGPAAVSCLLTQPAEQDSWISGARAWNVRARRVVCAVIRDTLTNSFPGDAFNPDDFAELESVYCAMSTQTKEAVVEGTLLKLLQYVDGLSSWRRVGEGKELRLGDTFIADWLRRLDVMGVPSSLVFVWVATYIHEAVRPYWPRFKQYMTDVATMMKEIIETRLLIPLQDIAADILNKNPGMMAGFGLDEESASLDRMLRDMGFGDGTEASRHEAFQRATEEYEKDLQGGLVGMLVKGRLVTLLLLQMQQLKVGLLSALSDIDILMQANRINFQVMAAIPAVVLFYLIFHFSIRRLYNIRAKDLRPMTAVHADMTGFLNNMERIIFQVAEPVELSSNAPSPSLMSLLSYPQLGQFVLSMHRYLILLDYSSPPYPQVNCNDIHATLLSFGGHGGTLSASPAHNLVVLHRIQQKNEALTKFL